MPKSSAILTPCSTKSEPSGPACVAHFARKREHTHVSWSTCQGPCQSRQRYLRAAAPRVSHPGPHVWHITRASVREHARQLVHVTKTTGNVHATLTSCSAGAKIGQSSPKHALVIFSVSSTDRVCEPHLLLGVHVGTFLDQSLDNILIRTHGSPDQGRPVLLRGDDTSRGCSLAQSDKAGAVGSLRSKF
jgi:hypothetical protein